MRLREEKEELKRTAVRLREEKEELGTVGGRSCVVEAFGRKQSGMKRAKKMRGTGKGKNQAGKDKSADSRR